MADSRKVLYYSGVRVVTWGLKMDEQALKRLIGLDLRFVRELEQATRNLRQIMGIVDLTGIDRAFLTVKSITAIRVPDEYVITLQRLGASQRFLSSVTAALESAMTSPIMELATRMGAYQAQLESWTMQHLAQAQALEEILRTRTAVFATLGFQPSDAVARVLASLNGILKVAPAFRPLLPELIQLPDDYLAFNHTQLSRLATEAETAEALLPVTRAAIKHAESMFLRSSIVLERALQGDEVPPEAGDGRERQVGCNVFAELARDLRRGCSNCLPEIGLDISQSPAARIHELGCALVERLCRILDLGTMLFRFSGRSLEMALYVPNLVATSRDHFGRVVDLLYFTLYEATGDGKRLQEVLGEDRPHELETLRYLRLYFRHDVHDVDVGDAPHKRHNRINRAFWAVSGVQRPEQEHEWMRAQKGLYQLLIHMLDRVHRKLSNGADRSEKQ